jgi:hypothetical protein
VWLHVCDCKKCSGTGCVTSIAAGYGGCLILELCACDCVVQTVV